MVAMDAHGNAISSSLTQSVRSLTQSGMLGRGYGRGYVFLTVVTVAASLHCRSVADCSYNGDCDGGLCHCDAAWRGARCESLNLLPARVGAGLNTTGSHGPIMSWGGTVNKGDDGKYHMHVAQFVNHCGFNQWATNSRIVHAVADSADGEFVVNSTVWPVFAHNPAVVRAPTGEWVMTFVSNTSHASHLEAACADGNPP